MIRAWASLLMLATAQTGAVELPKQNPFRSPLMLPAATASSAVKTGAGVALPVLRATLVGGDSPLALVGERLMKVGDEENGYRLVSVGEGQAVFEKAGTRMEVVLAPPAHTRGAEDDEDE